MGYERERRKRSWSDDSVDRKRRNRDRGDRNRDQGRRDGDRDRDRGGYGSRRQGRDTGYSRRDDGGRDRDRDRGSGRGTRDRSRDRRSFSESESRSRSSSSSSREPEVKAEVKTEVEVKKETRPRVGSKGEPQGILKELLDKYDAGTITEDEILLLKKMKLQRDWFEPPDVLFMAREGSQIVVRKNKETVDTVSIDGSPYYLFGKDGKVVEVHCEHPTISRVHCALYFEAGNKMKLIDLGSTHGTFLDKKQMEPMVPYDLNEDSMFRLAQSGRIYYMDIPKGPSKKELRKREEAQRRKQALEEVLSAAGPKRDEAKVRAEAEARKAAAREELLKERAAKKAAEEAKEREQQAQQALVDEAKAEEDARAKKVLQAQESEAKRVAERRKLLEEELQKAKEQKEAAEQDAKERRETDEAEKAREELAAEDNEVSDVDDACETLDVLAEKSVTKKLASMLLMPKQEWHAEGGWVKAQHLLPKLQDPPATIEHLKSFAVYDAQKRFLMKKVQGVHYIKSADVKQYHDNHIVTKPYTATGHLIHGTTLKAWKAIQKQGLAAIKRTYLYFTEELPTTPGAIEGLQRPAEVYLHIDAKKAAQDGIKFLASEAVICSPGKKGLIKAKYIVKAVAVKSGEVIFKK